MKNFNLKNCVVKAVIFIFIIISINSCYDGNKELDKTSYIAGYQSYLNLADRIEIEGVDDLIELLKEQGKDLSLVNWDYFKKGFNDAKKDDIPKYPIH